MDFQSSPYTPRSRELSSEGQISEDEGSEKSSPLRWSNPLYADSIDARLSKILSRAYNYSLTEFESDPRAAINELTLLSQKINVKLQTLSSSRPTGNSLTPRSRPSAITI